MIVVDPNKCPQNHICPLINLCLEKAISQKGNELPEIDREKCIECLICVKNCPRGAVKQIEEG